MGKRVARPIKPLSVGVSSLSARSEQMDRRSHLLVRLIKFVAITAIASLTLSALLVTPSMAVAASANVVVGQWDTMKSDLPTDIPLAQHTVLLDRNGVEFARFFTENRIPVTLDQISTPMKDALLAVEDDRFYDHGAIDVQGTVRAAARTATGNLQGGSTLTQQLVENILVANADDDDAVAAARAQSLGGKVQELRYASQLEADYSKDDILEMYFNTVYFGSGSYGVGAAAQRYFSVPASQLSIGQAATLAALMKSPTQYDPIAFPDASLARRNVVIERMRVTGRITDEQAAAETAAPLGIVESVTPNGCTVSTYPLYCAYVQSVLLSDPAFGETSDEREEALYQGGVTYTTALDPKVMASAQESVNRALSDSNRVAAAEAVVEPGSGLVSAIVQSKGYGSGENQTEIIYAIRPAFQPGSSFKPFVLTTAVEQGFDVRSTMTAPTGYKPSSMDSPKNGFRNDGSNNFGAIDAYEATKNSVNTWYIKLIERTGVEAAADMATRLGITSLPREGDGAITSRSASLALGAYEVSPLEMANAYATIAAHGVACNPTPISAAVRTATGEPAAFPDSACHQAIEADVANTVADVMTGPLTPGGTAGNLGIGRPAAGKTGTTNDAAATWFVGFTPQYSSAVWVGDPRGGQKYPLRNITAYGKRINNVFGASVAAPIWNDTMTRIEEGLPVLPLSGEPSITTDPAARVVPDVVGMSTDDAMSALVSGGYNVVLAPETAAIDGFSVPDQVTAQSPESGVDVDRTKTVTLTLSNGSDTSVLAPSIPDTETN